MRRKNSAYWVRRTHVFRKDEFECSSCGQASDKPYRVCPHCGASMTRQKYDASWVDEMEILDEILGE